MSKYRTKSTFVDAFVWTGDHEQTEDPEWIVDAINRGDVVFENIGTPEVTLIINARLNPDTVYRGEYITRSADGIIRAYSPQIFAQIYEAAE